MHKCVPIKPVTILVAVRALKAASASVVRVGIIPGGLETTNFCNIKASKMKRLWEYNERITPGVNTAGSPALGVH